MRLEVNNNLYIAKSKVGAKPELTIKNHWNDDKIVVIEIGSQSYEFLARELRAAIDNATNTARY